jgi:hypothetical protein
MQILGIVRFQPHGDAPPEVSNCVEIDERLADSERNGLGSEDHGMRGAHRGSSEAKVLGVERAMVDALAPHSLTVTEFAVLTALKDQPGLSNADLARRTFVTPQSMHAVLKELENRKRPPSRTDEGWSCHFGNGSECCQRTGRSDAEQVLRSCALEARRRTLVLYRRSYLSFANHLQQGTSIGMPNAVRGSRTQLFTVNFVLRPISTNVVNSTVPPCPARKVGLWWSEIS